MKKKRITSGAKKKMVSFSLVLILVLDLKNSLLILLWECGDIPRNRLFGRGHIFL